MYVSLRESGLRSVPGEHGASLNDVSNQTQTPIPGSGHDYQHLLGETVNFSNGSVNFKISFPVPKSRGITLPYGWTYNSAGANPLNMIDGNQPAWDAYWTQSAPGVDGWDTWAGIPSTSVAIWTFKPPDNQYQTFAACNVQSGMTFTDSSGVMHNLYTSAEAASATGSGYVPVCGTQMYVPPGGDGQVAGIPDPNTATQHLAGTSPQTGSFIVTDKNGTVYSFGGYYTAYNGLGGVNQVPVYAIEDRNGNSISIPGTGNAIYTDTAGRPGPIISQTQTITASSGQNFYFPATLVVNNLTYTATWTTVPVNYNVSATGLGGSSSLCQTIPTNVNGTRMVLSSLALPNGQSYSFQYNNPYGLLSEITYPDGGWVKYSWQLLASQNEIAFWSGFQQQSGPNGTLWYSPVNYGCGEIYQTPVLLSRTVSFDGTTVAQTQNFTSYNTTWAYGSGGGINGWSQKTTTVQTTDNVVGLSANTKYTYLPYNVPAQPYASGAQVLPFRWRVRSTTTIGASHRRPESLKRPGPTNLT